MQSKWISDAPGDRKWGTQANMERCLEAAVGGMLAHLDGQHEHAYLAMYAEAAWHWALALEEWDEGE